jgi:polygalacturonase
MKLFLILLAIAAVVVFWLAFRVSHRNLPTLGYPAYVRDFGGCSAEALKNARAAVRGTGTPLVLCDGSVEPGAWGDGKHDDTEAIRNAVNLSGDVHFPPGVYLEQGGDK